MAQPQAPQTGQKRGPGRPPRTSTPAAKKQKTAAPTPPAFATPNTRSPAVDSPAPEKKVPKLPSKVLDSKSLPTLAESQQADLPSDEYQSIAASNVLATAINRSRLKWINEGVLKRYWVKPEKGGKNAKPQPPNNPEAKWMKAKGECRIRLEPHLFVAQIYVEEKPRPKQTQPIYGYGQQYRSPQSQPYMPQPVQQFQSRAIPPISQPATPQPAQSSQPPIQQQPPQRAPTASSPAAAPPPGQLDKKPADPVISMLANRASSDPSLKALMKEVATGNANPDQLKVFQKHIDELTAIIAKQSPDGKDQPPQAPTQPTTAQYDGAADQRSQLQPQPRSQAIQPQQQAPRVPYIPQPPPPVYPQPPQWTPPTNLPVILEFQTVGATEDRFLFPEYSILESLSPQHELVSFMVVRKGSEAVDHSGLEPDKEYWQPITMMVEVAYGREDIMTCIRRWVKPAAEVHKYMEDVMQRCQRAPESYLALKLPFKGSSAMESGEVSKEATPVVVEERPKPKAAVKSAGNKGRPPVSVAAPGGPAGAAGAGEALSTSIPAPTAKQHITSQQPTNAAQDASSIPNPDNNGAATGTSTAAAAAADGTTESSRPRRAHRKSVRISEG